MRFFSFLIAFLLVFGLVLGANGVPELINPVDDSTNVGLNPYLRVESTNTVTRDFYFYEVYENPVLKWTTQLNVDEGIEVQAVGDNVYALYDKTLVKFDASNGNVEKEVEHSDAINTRRYWNIDVNSNYVFLMGGISIYRYSHSLNRDWHKSSLSDVESIEGLTLDSNNLFIYGSPYPEEDGLRKLDLNGNEFWSFYSDGFAIQDLEVDSSGNSYGLGYTPHPDYTAGLYKIDSSGNEVWYKDLGYEPYRDTYSIDVSIDDFVYVAIKGEVLTKYDTSGNEIWSKNIGTEMMDVRTDVLGYVYLAQSNVIKKYDPSGNLIWQYFTSGNVASIEFSTDGATSETNLYYITYNGEVGKLSIYDKIGNDNNVGSGGTAEQQWSGLSDKTEYSWYAGVSGVDIFSPIWTFTTGYKPEIPTLEFPHEGITVSEPATLEVYVEDKDSTSLDVSFYSGSGSLINSISVSNGTIAETDWTSSETDLSRSWYVVVSDGNNEVTSSTFNFYVEEFEIMAKDENIGVVFNSFNAEFDGNSYSTNDGIIETGHKEGDLSKIISVSKNGYFTKSKSVNLGSTYTGNILKKPDIYSSFTQSDYTTEEDLILQCKMNDYYDNPTTGWNYKIYKNGNLYDSGTYSSNTADNTFTNVKSIHYSTTDQFDTFIGECQPMWSEEPTLGKVNSSESEVIYTDPDVYATLNPSTLRKYIEFSLSCRTNDPDGYGTTGYTYEIYKNGNLFDSGTYNSDTSNNVETTVYTNSGSNIDEGDVLYGVCDPSWDRSFNIPEATSSEKTVGASYFVFTAKDKKTGSTISSFSIDFGGSSYSTSNGEIITDVLRSNTVYEISFYNNNNYLDKVENININNNYEMEVLREPDIYSSFTQSDYTTEEDLTLRCKMDDYYDNPTTGWNYKIYKNGNLYDSGTYSSNTADNTFTNVKSIHYSTTDQFDTFIGECQPMWSEEPTLGKVNSSESEVIYTDPDVYATLNPSTLKGGHQFNLSCRTDDPDGHGTTGYTYEIYKNGNLFDSGTYLSDTSNNVATTVYTNSGSSVFEGDVLYGVCDPLWDRSFDIPEETSSEKIVENGRFKFTAKDKYTSNVIQSFSIKINGDVFSTTDGIVNTDFIYYDTTFFIDFYNNDLYLNQSESVNINNNYEMGVLREPDIYSSFAQSNYTTQEDLTLRCKMDDYYDNSTIGWNYKIYKNSNLYDSGTYSSVTSDLIFADVFTVDVADTDTGDTFIGECQPLWNEIPTLGKVNSSESNVINSPPDDITNLEPADSISLSKDWVNLSFTTNDPDGDTVTNYIFAGKNQSDLSLIYSGTQDYYNFSSLDDLSSYYWKVKSSDGFENKTSTTREFFVTYSAPAISMYGDGSSLTSSITSKLRNTTSLIMNWSAYDSGNISNCTLDYETYHIDYSGNIKEEEYSVFYNTVNNDEYYTESLDFSELKDFTINNKYDFFLKWGVSCYDTDGNFQSAPNQFIEYGDITQPFFTVGYPVKDTIYTSQNITAEISHYSDFCIDEVSYELQYNDTNETFDFGTIVEGSKSLNGDSCDFIGTNYSNYAVNNNKYTFYVDLNVPYYSGGYNLKISSVDTAGNSVTKSRVFSTQEPESEPVSTGGGGGGGSYDSRKQECDVIIKPTDVSFGEYNRLKKIKVTNNEDFTLDPEIRIMGDLSRNLEITNVIQTVLPAEEGVFGLKYAGEVRNSTSTVVVSSGKCEDIEISVSTGDTGSNLFSYLFSGNTKISDFLAQPILAKGNLPNFLNIGLVYGVCFLLFILIFSGKIIKSITRTNYIVSFIWFIFSAILSFVVMFGLVGFIRGVLVG